MNKQLTIRSSSANPADTFVQAANSSDHVFEITADYVTISGFTVKEGNAGIYLDNVEHCIISTNNASINSDGISLFESSNSSISNNKVSNNRHGIYLDQSSNNSITNNNAWDNSGGIVLRYCSNDSIIENNTANSNNQIGIQLYKSFNNTISNNSANSNLDSGIEISYSSNNIIKNNIANLNSYTGMLLYDSSNNFVMNNTVNSNTWGISLSFSSTNTLSSNNVSNNNYSLVLSDSNQNNIFYLNNFIGNKEDCKIYSSYSNNIWNSTTKITYIYKEKTYTNYLGNFWSDYTGSDVDSDGISDTAYYISGDNDDNYPLMERFENYRIISNQPPTASFTYFPENPVIGDEITFNASDSSDSDGYIASYEWNFGDGNITNTTEQTITHSYTSAGNYTVSLTVTDNAGAKDTTSKLINVSDSQIIASGALGYGARKLARTSDGVLHCVYHRSDGEHFQIYHSYSSDDGETWTEEALTSESYNLTFRVV